MKAVFRLLAPAVVLLVMAVPPAFARSSHSSSPQPDPPDDLQVMSITDAWYPDLIVAPPITRPAASSYDTPKPPSASAEIPLTPVNVAANAISSSPSGAADTANVEHASTGSSMEIMTAAVDGRKIDGAAISAPQNGVQTAAVSPPSSSDAKGATARTPGSILFDDTHDDSTLDPANWAVNIFKKQQALIVYYKGRLFKRYDAVFGRALDHGAKQWAQDRRTPEGVYTIIEKYRSVRFDWFLRLNYPNLEDRVRYETEKINGVVPVDADGKSPTVGSAIGIHGTDVPILNAGHINWTTGCISVENNDIDDLARLLPVGTVVIIKP